MEAVFEKTGKDAAAVVSHFETVAEVMDEVGSRLPAVGRSDVVLLMGLDGEGCSSAGWPRCQRRILATWSGTLEPDRARYYLGLVARVCACLRGLSRIFSDEGTLLSICRAAAPTEDDRQGLFGG